MQFSEMCERAAELLRKEKSPQPNQFCKRRISHRVSFKLTQHCTVGWFCALFPGATYKNREDFSSFWLKNAAAVGIDICEDKILTVNRLPVCNDLQGTSFEQLTAAFRMTLEDLASHVNKVPAPMMDTSVFEDGYIEELEDEFDNYD